MALISAETTISGRAGSDGEQISKRKRRSIADQLAPLERIAGESTNLSALHGAWFTCGGATRQLVRYREMMAYAPNL
jgi:hypothetical protein